MLTFISSTLLRQGVCVCVYHLYRCKTSSRGVWHSCPTTRNEAVGMSEWGETWPVSCTCFIILYIVPPLGAFKSQLGGTYIIPMLFYIVIDSCDYIFIYVYHLVLFLLVSFAMNDTFRVNNSSSCSKQVCVCEGGGGRRRKEGAVQH